MAKFTREELDEFEKQVFLRAKHPGFYRLCNRVIDAMDEALNHKCKPKSTRRKAEVTGDATEEHVRTEEPQRDWPKNDG